MNDLYALIGRLWVRYILMRYKRQIRAAAAVTVLAVGIGGYLALTREVKEG